MSNKDTREFRIKQNIEELRSKQNSLPVSLIVKPNSTFQGKSMRLFTVRWHGAGVLTLP